MNSEPAHADSAGIRKTAPFRLTASSASGSVGTACPLCRPDTIRAHAEYCLRESQWFLRGMLWNLAEQVPAANWMSLPVDIQRAESKRHCQVNTRPGTIPG